MAWPQWPQVARVTAVTLIGLVLTSIVIVLVDYGSGEVLDAVFNR